MFNNNSYEAALENCTRKVLSGVVFAAPNPKASSRGNMWSVMAHTGFSGVTIKKAGAILHLPKAAIIQTGMKAGQIKKSFLRHMYLTVENCEWLYNHGAEVEFSADTAVAA